MSQDLTVDNLCDAIRHFIGKIVEDPAQPVDQTRGLVLYGTAGDETMKTLMELFEGTLKITVRTLPPGLREGVLATSVVESGGVVVWQPNREAVRA